MKPIEQKIDTAEVKNASTQTTNNTAKQSTTRGLKRWIFITLGCLCVGLGALGVFVPGLPCTPLLLLSSWLFYKSSLSMQQWLLDSHLGVYIREYERRGGMTLRQRLWALGLMATMVTLSCVCFISSATVRIIVAIAGAIGCVVVGFIVPSAK
ncbi:MAG: YbaN family protein [Rikenellaceae bacterium]|nr:YbaN family protein [Rikenellaceae bacterium]